MNRTRKPVFGRMLDDPQAISLVDAYHDGHATDDDRERLGQLLRSSSDVLDYFIARSHLVGELSVISTKGEPEILKAVYGAAWDDTDRDGIAAAPHTVAASPVSGADVATQDQSLVSPRRQSTVLVMQTALAASIVFAVIGWFFNGLSRQRHLPEIKQLGFLYNTSAGEGDSFGSFARAINEQTPLSLQDGEYEVRLNNGVVLAIAAPAEILLQSVTHCRLDSGRVTATVPRGAEGFRIFTSLAEIVDHGTRFGVSVSQNGNTDVAVFEGEVQVLSSDQERRLEMGRAVSIAGNGEMSRLAVVRPDSFELPRSTANAGPTITSVGDNIRSPSAMKYYRIIQGGFGEDQPAYVDRVHQWNALDSQGLPAELVGADYVMTFNDDKAVRDIEVTVSLSQEADIYILLDERVDQPQWLLNDFMETEFKVGMDEGERPGHPEDPRTLSAGPAQSVDYCFSVWRRKSPSAGTITLGGLPNMGEWQSMYGIVAVPVAASK